MELNELFVIEVPSGSGRKKIVQKSHWKRKKAQLAGHSPRNPPVYLKCGHLSGKLECATLTMQDVVNFNEKFYKDAIKLRQDRFISRFCVSATPNRKRPRNNTKSKEKCITYFVLKGNRTEGRVCRSAFLGILGITKHRVLGVTHHFLLAGDLTENRGGDRKSKLYEGKLEAVKNFIKSLKADDSHYCRGKSIRQYLPAELNITKLFKMYKQKADDSVQVKFSYFHYVFTTYFNVGFGSPKTDACSTCIELKERIKVAVAVADDEETKQLLETPKKLHTLRAKAFFTLLQEKRIGLMTFSYDCEKNLVLPKVPDQRAYYSRQLYCYNFSVVKGTSKCSLNQNNIFTYSWLEHESFKGSNEIASALYHCLKKNEPTMADTNTVRLVSDGCPGQNKNCILLAMCAKWLKESPRNIKELQIVFPITGHSYLPPDRVFGTTEKKLTRMDTIILPEEYYAVFQQQATLFLLGKDSNVQNWKAAAETVIKAPSCLHLKISKIKRLILKRTLKNNINVLGELNDRSSTSNALPITKRNRTISQITPAELPVEVPVKEAKKKDVEKLITAHFGKEWSTLPTLMFFKDIFCDNVLQEEVENEDDSEPRSEFLAEVPLVQHQP